MWEELLEITYTRPLTLDQRKRVVIARLAGYGHIGEPEIRGIIANYTERAVAVDFQRGVVFITIEGRGLRRDEPVGHAAAAHTRRTSRWI